MSRLCPRHGARQGRAPGATVGRRLSRLAPPLPTRITRAARWGHRALPPLHPRNSPARALSPRPSRAPPAPLPRPSRAPPRRIARGGSPPRGAAWQVAHAESFAGRGSVRGMVRDRVARPARYHDRTALSHAHYPGGAMGTSRPTAITPAIFARILSARCGAPPRRAPPPCPTLVSTRRAPRSCPVAVLYARVPWR